ncbi:hypothetical protein N7509_008267 [Penicillium cosmopolitanum]|uniref:Uncharacterized protein n=1 Tax=Penicillium cosmopolitanum TaxID=1131564 RepID=A0A9W9VM88_9EURO|nr:uncharacterized protein N7509_008267 [Penicillium cosmopolitanum]KAJ5385726.1 hypothetical protein N7509_008267 [Penicillium cosmopolitanum]
MAVYAEFSRADWLNFTPVDGLVRTWNAWPLSNVRAALNRLIEWALIRPASVASSYYPGIPFNSPENYTSLQDRWTHVANYAVWPESVGYFTRTTPSFLTMSRLML